MRLTFLIVYVLLCLGPQGLAAQTENQDLAYRLQALEERVRALEAELRALKESRERVPTAPPGEAAASVADAPAPSIATGGSSGQLPAYGGARAQSKLFNPHISVIGDFLGAAGRDPIRPVPVLEMHESEVVLQAILDPYARGDFFFSFGEEGVELEEGYLTFTSFPAGVLVKVGKMRSSFGRVNTLHNHSLPWTDRPLMTDNLVGGEDGITDAGISLSHLLPAPRDIFLEITGQVFRGDAGEVFQANRRSDVSFVGHLRGNGDLNEATNLDLGFSYARGRNDPVNGFLTQLYGVDATLRWKPLRRAIYRSFILRTELTWSQRNDPFTTQRAFGYFTSLDYQLTRRWFLGGRYDWSEKAESADLHDSGSSIVLTFWPSEFSQVRAQYRYTSYAENRTGNELRFQFLFSLGAHGAHPF